MKDRKPLISVIVPVYNILDYLPRCVQSLTSQTYRELEILLVDDGSTDGTGKLCDELAKGEKRIRVLHKKNGGTSSARNLGIANAKGEYLGFVDSDDYVEPGMYERLYEAITLYRVKASQTGRDEIDAQGIQLPNICDPPAAPECIGEEDFLRELLMHRGDCSFCTKLIARECFDGLDFPEGLLNEDFRLLVWMLPRIGKIVSLPGRDYHVFYRMGSNTRRTDRESFSRVYGDCVDNADMAVEIVREKYPALQKTVLRFGVYQRLEYLLHIPIRQMNRENSQYFQVVRWIRRNWLAGMCNPFLSWKNKLYHTLFALAPKWLRKIHRRLRHL